MGADEIAGTADRPLAVGRRWGPAPDTDQRRFWIGLTCAAVLHVALIVGVGSALPRHMGEPEGSFDGISVDLVDAADYMSRTTSPPQDTPAASPASAAPPPQPVAKAAPDSASAAAPQKKTAPPSADNAPDLFSLPDVTGKQSGAAASSPSKPTPPSQPNSAPRLDVPDAAFSAPQGRSAAVARPPGVTRSGENDEFGRGVIRALRQTMPSPSVTTGRVTVRLFLSDSGNLAEVQLVRSGGDAYLDQSVVFAVKQASFPVPPKGSTLSDRTFLVTYVYR